MEGASSSQESNWCHLICLYLVSYKLSSHSSHPLPDMETHKDKCPLTFGGVSMVMTVSLLLSVENSNAGYAEQHKCWAGCPHPHCCLFRNPLFVGLNFIHAYLTKPQIFPQVFLVCFWYKFLLLNLAKSSLQWLRHTQYAMHAMLSQKFLYHNS